MRNKINLNLSSIAAGGLQENFNLEIQKVFENIHDPNTEAKAKRTLTLTLTVVPDENREVLAVDSAIKLALAPTKSVATTIITGVNASGEVEAQELKSGAKGQTYFDPDDNTLKTDIGIPVDEIEKSGRVIDLQKRKQG
ncbi:MAG: replication terminator protein [Streptococcaceae bacterium]|jgi:hypothetical protein|nr:replication terminator protein [Streptococcaceae bacterium]